MSDIDSTPKWAREARDHLINLSARLDATEAYDRSLDSVRDEMLAAIVEVLAAWDMEEDTLEHNQQDRLATAIEALRELRGVAS